MAVFAFVLLVAAAPIMRGGNRHVALILLEGAAMAFLALGLTGRTFTFRRPSLDTALLLVLLTSPVWLAIIYLLPLPGELWTAMPGRAEYAQVMSRAGITDTTWLPVSLVPDATATSLSAGILLVAGFLAGYWLSLPQLQMVVKVILGLAFIEIVLALLQAAGGTKSPLYFGAAGGRPMGTFANPNHLANYLAIALTLYIWLAWTTLARSRNRLHLERGTDSRVRRLAIWGAGGLIIAIGLFIARSRGAMLAGLPAALAALALVVIDATRTRNWRVIAPVLGIALGLAVAMVGFDFALSRFRTEDLGASAEIRNLLARTTLEGALQFWPTGAGWGTYETVYPRFQPAEIVGVANYAHQDYAQLLFEGGIFAIVLMAAFAWLAGKRTVLLVRTARRRRLRREEMLCAICGLGLLGFLLHSFVEFNMHIPANAIMASLLAGIFLRPFEDDPSRTPEQPQEAVAND
ncbi:O-antigen ligase family protein [Ramlibacter sp. USB13]|uniref:O-antigen ligase family protein n=1 Tax=Ramlibacter cellulosilyticus TaxID=2764187 RepID=A0A923S9F6_9BURK|nr:O-antigen ligase family protein [Ramlibacter cellulosilyticus]